MIITHTIAYAFSLKEDYEAWQTFLKTKSDDWVENINSTTAQYVMSRSWIKEKGNEEICHMRGAE